MIPLLHRALSPLLRAFFYLLYHPFAWTYDAVAAGVSLGMWKTWVYAILPFVRGKRILELGHGPGHLQAALHLRGIEPIGVDRSPQMGRQAQRRLRQLGHLPRLINGAAQTLPFASAAFDQVIATFPTEYIVDPATLAEIQRVLQPHGDLIVLPLAWITGTALPQRAAAGLFRFTGQASEWNPLFLQPFQRAGFETHTERIPLHHSQVLILWAHKRPQLLQ
jgi:ubiquinone/menaquinone biosynthesis C-methylase UbiE